MEPMPMPTLKGAVRPSVVEDPVPPKHPRLAALGDVAVGTAFVVLITGLLERNGFGWFLVIWLIAASGVLGAKVATLNRLLRNQDTDGHGVAEPS